MIWNCDPIGVLWLHRASVIERANCSGIRKVRFLLHNAIRRILFFFLRPWDGMEIPETSWAINSKNCGTGIKSGGFSQQLRNVELLNRASCQVEMSDLPGGAGLSGKGRLRLPLLPDQGYLLGKMRRTLILRSSEDY